MRSQEIRDRLKDIEEFLLDQYKENREEKKRDWRTYEKLYESFIKRRGMCHTPIRHKGA